jgi:bacteriorhodopsin
MPETRLFLERQSYRRRRMMDAVRMLPLLCAVLWMLVPTMWSNSPTGEAQTTLSSAIWYLFMIWVLAITASFALWRRIRNGGDVPLSQADLTAVSDSNTSNSEPHT